KKPRDLQQIPPANPTYPRLAECAAEAWEMVARETEPMLPHAAVDWVRQEAECEDGTAVKKALYWAAGHWLESRRPDKLYGSIIHSNIKEGEFDSAYGHTKNLTHVAAKWHDWYHTAQRVIALCRELEAA